MRRNRFSKEAIKTTLLLLAILAYGALSDILYWLPPLLGVAFILFCEFMDKGKVHYAVPLLVYLLFFEASKGFPFLSTIIFFFIVYFLIIPHIRYLVHSGKYLLPFYALFIYYSYFLFCYFLGSFMGIDVPEMSWILILFSVIEAIILVLII
ncbi:hypothetical protein CCZ01_01390 [Helicobacter monodelphidis]|nr:hypothetical protein CCZ01_01390 [Helicobacter sp. 15-1451]